MARLIRINQLIFFLLLGSCFQLYSQTIELKFDNFPAKNAQCFHHDVFGFMWIGTQDGLIRYDGNIFKHYRHLPFDSTSISNNWVSDIQEDRNGNLWIGTYGGGLNYYDQKTEIFSRFSGSKEKNTNNYIIKIIVNEDGSLWFTGMMHTLTHFIKTKYGRPKYTHYNLFENLPSESFPSKNSAMSAYKDRKGIIWLGTAMEGMLRFDPATGEMEQFKHDPQNPNSLSFNTISTICEDDSGNIWIGTGLIRLPGVKCGLNMFNPKTKKFRLFQHSRQNTTSIASNKIASILIDKTGTMWIATFDNYLDTIPMKELLFSSKPVFRHHTNLKSQFVLSVYEDRIGNFWIGERGFTSQKYDHLQNPFGLLKGNKNYPKSMTGTGAWCTYTDRSGRIWAGTYGLDVYNPNTGNYSHYYHDSKDSNSISENEICCIQEDPQGKMWIATKTQGINILNPESGNFEHIYCNPGDSSGLMSDNISYVLPRKNGDVWMATIAGLQLYHRDTGKFHSFNLETGTNEDLSITKLFEDRCGTLWIGTLNSGLFEFHLDKHFNPKIFHYTHDPQNPASLSYNSISDFIKPSIIDTSAIWIATAAGLNRLDLKSKIFTHLFTENGLATNWIATILEDNQGNLWCTTLEGVSFIRIRTLQIINFGTADGFPIDYETGAYRQNGSKGQDGRLYFAGGGGILNFQPADILENKNIPPVKITDFKVFQKSISLDTSIQFKRNITLFYYQNIFSFDFAALNFTNPDKNQYKYKLEGFNDDWIDIGNVNTAIFTNLDPGEYIFRVKGSNNHGIWNEDGASLNIIILPPWWKTNWAYISYVFIFILIVIALRRYDLKRQKLKHELEMEQLHTEKLQEVDRLKSHFFANISHEFRTPLTLLLGPISRLLGKISDREDVKDLQVMHKNAKRLQKLINELLDLSKIEEGKLKLQVQELDIIPFINRIVQTFESQAEIKNIELKFRTKIKSVSAYIDINKMENVFYNLLSNAFKFTPDGGVVEVTISLQRIPKIGATKQSQEEIATTAIRQSRDDNRSKDCIQITVTNTGSVIPSEKINHIFDRFYQVDDSFTREHEGSGIGLALTNELVKLHYGTTEVESNSESGTIFTITLPLGKQHFAVDEIYKESIKAENKTVMELENSPTDINEKNEEKQSTKLLIVEDNADMRQYIKSCLNSYYFIIEAQDGISGFDKSVNELPDLIISDVMMPKMDGFQLCEKIKSDQRTSHIPVILLTARAEMKDKINGLDTGADDYVVKPFEVKELQARVRNLILQRQKLQQQFMKNEMFNANELAMTSQDEKFLNKAIEIIENNISDSGFDVDSFVKNIGISRAHLYHKFKTITGQSVKDFIRTIRLKRSLQMIKNNTGNISEIAYEVGFSNPAYFSKCFREQFGYSPSQFSNRKKH